MYAPSPDNLPALRRQQAEFARTTQDLDRQNSWMAIPALAPFALPVLDGMAALGVRAAAGSVLPKDPFDFPEIETWQRNSRQPGRPLDRDAKAALRGAGRDRVAEANGMRAIQLDAEVHHSDPLEWAHLKPGADPNRFANLWALPKEAHAIATQRWAAFSRSLQGRTPTQAELMRTKLDIDREVAPYLRTPGVSTSRLPPNGGVQ